MLNAGIYWWIDCDREGCKASTRELEGEVEPTADDAREEARATGWISIVRGDKIRWYCIEHQMVENGQMVPLPDGWQGEMILAERRIAGVIARATKRAEGRHLTRCLNADARAGGDPWMRTYSLCG